MASNNIKNITYHSKDEIVLGNQPKKTTKNYHDIDL